MAPQSARRSGSAPLSLPVRTGVRPWTPYPTVVPIGRSRSFSRSPMADSPLPVTFSRSRKRTRQTPRDPLAEGVYSDAMFYQLTGVRKYQFRYFYDTYCGPHTPLNSHHKLFALLYWYKVYPQTSVLCWQLYGWQISRRLVDDIKRWSGWLARKINNAELLKVWHARLGQHNRLPDVPSELFGGQVTGHLDTFPIYLCRPQNSLWQRFTYNGKYGANVLKVQMVVDNTGTPMWLSGPHLGSWADIRLARQHMPDVEQCERLLADKAYCASDMHHLSVPYKKARKQRKKRGDRAPPPPPPKLTRQQQAFNIVRTHSTPAPVSCC